MIFADLDLIAPLLRATAQEGYKSPTPIQAQAVLPALQGRDILGCAQTGTGKTAAFALPILQRLATGYQPTARKPPIRALILSPTRELAAQIDDSFTAYGRHLRLSNMVIFGGVSQRPQTARLKGGIDILTATPGRLLDLHQQGYITFEDLQIFVLDEADRMLDMGFIHDVRRVIATIPQQRQTLFFSATMPPDIQDLADTILHNPVTVAVAPPATTVELIEQSIFFVEKRDKRNLLVHLLQDPAMRRILVFTRTKHGANRVATHLQKRDINAQAIHGNKSQGARERALNGFKQGQVRVLVATDIAARGIDVDQISHVVNFDIPNIAETYVHRIGRTARAGASGIALSFCQEDERPYLVDIERLIGQHVPVVEDHPQRSPLRIPAPTDLSPQGRRRSQAPSAPRSRPPRRRPRGRGRPNPAHSTNQPPRSGRAPAGGPPATQQNPSNPAQATTDTAAPRPRRRRPRRSGPKPPPPR